MLLTDLPNPGTLVRSMQLRKEVTNALTAVELSGNPTTQADLLAFFEAAVKRLKPAKPKKGVE